MITYRIAPSPKWYFADAVGKPASGGFMITRSSLDHTTPKFVYSDPAGLNPYDNPMQLDESGGTECPIYWQDNGIDLYYVLITDKFGNKICEVVPFPLDGGGGVTPITTSIDIENHLVNGQFLFIDAIDEADSVLTPVPADSVTHMAPGSGFFKDADGNYVRTTASSVEAGWTFVKAGGVGATDTVSFVAVTTLGVGFPNGPSANATRYFRYQLTAIGTPITDAAWVDTIPNVECFQNEIVTVSIDTKADILGAVGELQIIQNFGTGGAPSAPVITTHVLNFTPMIWSRQSFTVTIPSIMGKTKGTNLDDFISFRFVSPLNTLGTFDQVNHQIQRGTFGITPYIEQTYAQDQFKVLIDLITYGNVIFPTGELKWMSVAVDSGGAPIDIAGWIPIANSNTPFIGNTTSGAFNAGTQFKNLYVAWWNCFPQSECVVSTGRGADALSDFNANKAMTAPGHIINTVLAGAGDGLFINASFGQFEGVRGFPIVGAQGGATFNTISTSDSNNAMQPTLYLWLYVKL